RTTATGIATETGSALFVPQAALRDLVGRDLTFGSFVFDTLLRRRHAVERLAAGIQIIGSRFDHDTHRLPEFAVRNRLLHTWVDADVEHFQPVTGVKTAPTAPIAIVANGVVLRNPTNSELARAIGLREAEIPPETCYDLVVIGAGPSGLAAGVYGASSGL